MNDAPIVLIDVMYLAFRSHYAFRNLSSNGSPTGMLFGFLKTVRDLRQSVSTRIVFCWDHGVPIPGAIKPRNWREDVVQKYKATRKRDENFALVLKQLPILYSVLSDVLGYGSVSVMGMEADDMIGILTNEYRGRVLIFSADRDMYQLLSGERIQVIVPKKNGGAFQYITEADIKTEYGIDPIRWAEYLALGGDSSDNIKPAAGMGPKTALKIILAGAWASQVWDRQPEDFRKKYAKYESVWPEVQKSLYAARIPRTWSDSRIARCIPNGHPALPDPEPRFISTSLERSMRKFETFCSDYGMLSLLASRRQFFSSPSQGEPLCQAVRQPPVQALPVLQRKAAPPLPLLKRKILI